jgi:NAD(P)-dependent dehydrogenase (short-subunit alcohol dehydrogenase family)
MGTTLRGKIAVVTGGSTGIGLGTAKQFIAEGAFVFITGRRQEALDEALRALGPSAAAIRADVSKLGDLDRVFETVKAQKGRIDVLVANAGIAEPAPLGAITEEQYDRQFGTNVKGLVFTVQKALPLMSEGSSIILISSIVANKGMQGLSIYSSTKAAIRNLARTWILDLKGRKIRVNVISPGPIETPGLVGLAGGEQAKQGFFDYLAAQVPLARNGRPEEIGAAAVFLASDAASYIHGADLHVDGGFAQI